MSLNRVTIEGFQSHKKTVLDFHAGVNAISGDTGHGKTAVVRAIKWCILNECDDSAFIRHGQSEVSVKLEFSDFTLERIRNTTGNIYKLTIGGKTETFKAFKQTIPSDIVDILNMNQINLQEQLDSHFLISKTPGERAKMLNNLVDLSIIHESISGIKKEALQNSRDIENVTEQIEENRKAFGAFKFLVQLEKDVEAYEVLQEQFEKVTEAKDELSNMIERVEELKERAESYSDLISMSSKVDRVLKSVEEYKKQARQLITIAHLINSICDSKEEYQKFEALIELEPKVKQAVDLVMSIDKIYGLIEKQKDLMQEIERREIDVAELETEYIEKLPEECPLCGNQMIQEIS